MTAEDIAKWPLNSLADLLRETAGVNKLTASSGRDEIQIRGWPGKYTLMQVNGRRLSSGGALWRGSDFDFSPIPLNSIKRWHATLAADGKLITQQERPCWLGVTPRQQRPARQCVVRCLNR